MAEAFEASMEDDADVVINNMILRKFCPNSSSDGYEGAFTAAFI